MASLAFADVLSVILASVGVLGVLGVLCCIKTAFVYPKPLTHPMLQATFLQKPYFKTKQVCLLWLGQIVFVCLSFVLFHFLETQTQIDTRLALVETGYIVKRLQQNALGLGLMPFVLYAVLGVGLAYFSVCLGEKPILARAFFSQTNKPTAKWVLFSHNFVSRVVEIVITFAFIGIVTFTLFWLCETVNAYLGLGSLFSVPLRTLFILALMTFVFRKMNKQLIAWMTQHHISVGQFLLVYILIFSLFVLWLHGTSDWLTLSLSVPALPEQKSYFAGAFEPKVLESRIQYLIWGWWSIWIPWMASLVARSSIGFSIARAVSHALLVPILLFGWGMQYWDRVEWALVYQWLQSPTIQLVVLAGILLFLWVMCGEMRTLGDLLKGAMLPVRRVSNRPLKDWITVLMLWLSCYIPSVFMLGWLPMQIMVTVGGLFMSAAVMMLIGVWMRFTVVCYQAPALQRSDQA